jgi:hypothetical protein
VDNLRVKIKIGEREFEAEGTREAVEARLEEAKIWLLKESAMETRRIPGPQNPEKAETEHPVYDVDRGQRTVRLRVLPPRGEVLQRLSNALLLLLYGYNSLLGRSEVPVTRMAEDLRMSGFAGLRRLSRSFERLEREGLASRSGSGKGTQYRATLPGLESGKTLAKSFSK